MFCVDISLENERKELSENEAEEMQQQQQIEPSSTDGTIYAIMRSRSNARKRYDNDDRAYLQ